MTPDRPPAEGDALPLIPLNARSLALSALLGTHPPELPVRALVALGDLFGIAPGTMRTALSRMLAAGEVTADDGTYRLAGPLLDRQRAQDVGRRSTTERWTGDWHAIIATETQRSLSERRRFRRTMADHRFAELRPDIWMRPANLPAPSQASESSAAWMVVTGPLTNHDSDELAYRLWDLDTIARTARTLGARLAALPPIDPDAPASTAFAAIPERFVLAAAVLRFLRAEPLLPTSIVGEEWPVESLRTSYADAESALRRHLRAFFRSTDAGGR